MDTDRMQPLLALLEWEEERDRWLRIPEECRERVVRDLARLLIRMAEAEAGNEREEDPDQAS